jgi:hypothetical protein
MHIDPAHEEQEQPVIEEPAEPEQNPEPEGPPQAADSAPEETDPSEEGRQAHILPANNEL